MSSWKRSNPSIFASYDLISILDLWQVVEQGKHRQTREDLIISQHAVELPQGFKRHIKAENAIDPERIKVTLCLRTRLWSCDGCFVLERSRCLHPVINDPIIIIITITIKLFFLVKVPPRSNAQRQRRFASKLHASHTVGSELCTRHLTCTYVLSVYHSLMLLIF
jgi:hypothetical protein